MRKLNKNEICVQNWIIENYKDNPEYDLLDCKEHGVFAKYKGHKKCPHCGEICNIYINS